MAEEWQVGDKAIFTPGHGEPFPVTIMKGSPQLPLDKINVMAHGSGSVFTANRSQLQRLP